MSGCDVNTRVLTRRRSEDGVSEVENDRSKRVGEGRSRGTQAASKSWKREGHNFSLKSPDEM